MTVLDHLHHGNKKYMTVFGPRSVETLRQTRASNIRAECRRRKASCHKCPRPDDPPRPCRPKASQGLYCKLFQLCSSTFEPFRTTRILQPTRRIQQALLATKRAIMGNRCQKTAGQASKRAPTGKPKVSRLWIPELSQDMGKL